VAGPPETLASVAHQVSQSQLGRYADASGDHNPLHLDPAFAAGTPYGRTIAHGMLVLAFLSEMLTDAFGMAWLTGGKLNVRFRAPVYPGDVVTTDGRLRSTPGNEQKAIYNVACKNQRGEQVITGDATVRWPLS
jgi:3-hydroxybutyryl-CoA dehydratase